MAPLAERMRPQTIEDMVGQPHLLTSGKAFRNILESGHIPNLIFYGPSGVGKTTVADIIAKRTDKRLYKLNGTTASIADIKTAIGELDTLDGAGGILLYLDEIQYFNKKQQQALLEHVENGRITLIAATTENPYFYIYGALLSRSTVFEFKSVSATEIGRAVEKAFRYLEQEQQCEITVEDGVVEHIAATAGGDVRRSINTVELCVLSTPIDADGNRAVTLEIAKQVAHANPIQYDKAGDAHYDIVSAYQKSMRGSDPDAALHYLARLLEAGDLPSACRRLLVCANEDVGLAYPMIIPIVKAAVDTALQVGLPEARIPLANAVVLVASAPKSNAVYNGINRAMRDLENGKTGDIPRTLQNKHFDGEDQAKKGQFYNYPHDFPGHWVDQQYLPDELKGTRYYVPGDNKTEQAFAEYWKKIKGR